MKQELEQLVAAVVKELFGTDAAVELTRPDEQFGDYATNVALQLSKQLGKNPREVAEALREKLAGDSRLQAVEVAGPGFLNLKVKAEVMARQVSVQDQVHTSEHVQVEVARKVLVEYSDPNPFKPLHAGHLYTTLVGDSIARLIENTGAETIRINYGGDVGLHVAKSMWSILKWLDGGGLAKLASIPEEERPKWLGERYVEGNNAYEDANNLGADSLEQVGDFTRLKPGVLDAKLDILAINKLIYEVAGGNNNPELGVEYNTGEKAMPSGEEFAQIYHTTRQWSYDYFKVLYDQLEVVPFTRYIPESEVTPLGVKTVKEQLEKGVYQESDGAVVFDGEKLGMHTRVFINSEGLPTYEAKDVGLSLTKWNDYHFDESIIITANEQEQYMRVVVASIHEFAPEPAERTKHLTHGVVKLQGGVKMSSRKGNVVTALEILEAAREAGKATGTNPSEETILAAVKYAFAKNRIGGDVIYDPKESIALEGNSGPYLQYAHARARSILAKAEQGSGELTDLSDDERSLLRKITEYAEVVEKATAELMPHHICTYLYELAQKFNQFYEHNRVIGDDRQAARLKLVEHYADTLKNGLELLGIAAPERM
ncbi:MAG TPA: arginine--tRNA ligase [Candidatus Saccharimonadales bacterium]|nr:arginine--tRNA ligase [Candidatus Saccharimonadales bacterium]